MTPRPIAEVIGAAAVAISATHIAPMPFASAAPCPDAEVVFARGTTEPPGVGGTGQSFVDALRAKVAGKSVNVYAVDYPATTDFPTAVHGIEDARARVLSTVANCPKTKVVLGGFSQGAAVMGFVTAGAVPDGVSARDVPAPMPPEVANHIAAVALFGKPSTRFMRAIREPDITIGPQYVGKTIDLCVPDDLVCTSDGRSFAAHNRYAETGVVEQGATFAATLLQASWAADALTQAQPPPGAAPAQTPPSPLTIPAPAAPVTPSPPSAATSPHLPEAPLTPPGPSAPVAPHDAVGPLA